MRVAEEVQGHLFGEVFDKRFGVQRGAGMVEIGRTCGCQQCKLVFVTVPGTIKYRILLFPDLINVFIIACSDFHL